MFKLFVSGFPLDITEIELVKLFFPYGNLLTVKIVRDKKTSICKGYAFLEMASRRDADDVIIALDGIVMGDRNMTVRLVPEATPSSSSESVQRRTPVYKKVQKKPEDIKGRRPRRVF